MAKPTAAVYGKPSPDLATLPDAAVQCSPCVPGVDAVALDEIEPGSLSEIVVQAPPGTVERRCVLALALRALEPGGVLVALARNDKGGTRLAEEIEAFGCTAEASHRRHHRIVQAKRPHGCDGLDGAIADGAPRRVPGLELWSQPGLFSFDRIDPGTGLLLDHLPVLEGRGADLGCGIGVLARAVAAQGCCRHMTLVDIDRRALEMARRNCCESGTAGCEIATSWTDVRAGRGLPSGLDFVVMNPPFHDAGVEDRGLGQSFITRAAGMLRTGGVLWLTANRHLPYEAALTPLFETIEQVAQHGGFKIYSARTGARLAGTPRSATDAAQPVASSGLRGNRARR